MGRAHPSRRRPCSGKGCRPPWVPGGARRASAPSGGPEGAPCLPYPCSCAGATEPCRTQDHTFRKGGALPLWRASSGSDGGAFNGVRATWTFWPSRAWLWGVAGARPAWSGEPGWWAAMRRVGPRGRLGLRELPGLDIAALPGRLEDALTRAASLLPPPLLRARGPPPLLRARGPPPPPALPSGTPSFRCFERRSP